MAKKPTEMVELVNEMRPNELNDDLLYFWLSNLEFRVLYEVLEGQDGDQPVGVLQVGAPHDDIYWTYLVSMIDFATGDMEAYARSSALAERAWKSFCKYYHRQKYKRKAT